MISPRTPLDFSSSKISSILCQNPLSVSPNTFRLISCIASFFSVHILAALTSVLRPLSETVVVNETDEVYEALIALGYKDKDVKNVIGRVNKENTVEEQIKEALRLMIK